MKNHATNWEVSIIELENTKGKLFKVTKKIPYLSIVETRIFRSKEKARELFDEWLE